MPEIELTPSVPMATPVTPSEPVAEVPVVIPEVTTPEPTTPVEPELFETPDGRKVDAATLQREWKENFLPDYTRKSQELAQLKTPAQDINNQPEWKKPGYVPQSYAEIIEIAERQAIEKISKDREAEEQHRASVSKAVDDELAAIRVKDPKLDANALFSHAVKYGFTSVTKAYENFAAMRQVATTTEERVLKGFQKKVDPIATGGAPGGGSAGTAVPYNGGFSPGVSAQDVLARLKGK